MEELTAVMQWDASGYHEYDARKTTQEYDWTLKKPITEVIDPDGLALTTRYAYDSAGHLILQTDPAGGTSTTTPSTHVTVYYAAIDNETDPQCGGHAEWDGLVCISRSGGQPSSGAELPSILTTYDMFGNPTVTTEWNSAGTLRTTTKTYDAAGRLLDTTVSAPGLGEPLEKRRTVYDGFSGKAVRSQTLDGSSAVTAEVITQYDTLGRVAGYTDADGNTSTTAYDIASRVASTNDGLATRTYTYDGGGERRGLATQVVDSLAGTFSAAYDVDGRVVQQTWPNGVVAAASFNEVGDKTGLNYSLPGCGTGDCTLFTDTVQPGVNGHWTTRSSTLSSQAYSYDKADRLTEVRDTVDGQCTVRAYTLDAASSRTAMTSYDPDIGGACQTTTTSASRTWTYDSASRMIGVVYTYDSLARTNTIAGVDTAGASGGTASLTYHVNDMVRTISQGSRTTTYALDVDPARIRSWTDNLGGTAVTKVNHYSDDHDSPAWVDESSSVVSRTMAGLSGMLGTQSSATSRTWMLANLHGDFVATMTDSGVGLDSTGDYAEGGAPRDSSDAGVLRYGWLGASQRAADTPGGIVLMGARLYATGIGRFLSVDPVSGGSSNPYDYCNGNPTDCYDLNGNYPMPCVIDRHKSNRENDRLCRRKIKYVGRYGMRPCLAGAGKAAGIILGANLATNVVYWAFGLRLVSLFSYWPGLIAIMYLGCFGFGSAS